MVQDTSLLDRHREVFTPDFFENHIPSRLAGLILKFHDSYEGPPSKASLKMLTQNYINSHENEQPHLSDYMECINEVYIPLPIPDHKYITDSLGELLKQSQWSNALMKSSILVNQGKAEEAAELVDRASRFSLDSEGSDGCTSLSEFDAERYINDESGMPIPTGFKTIDEEMNGGLRPKEVGVFCGGANKGKSQILHNIAAHLIGGGYTFLFLTMEMSELQTWQRIQSCISGLKFWDIAKDPEINKVLKKYLAKICKTHPSPKYCEVMYRPMKSITVKEFFNFIHKKYAKVGSPDIILIDYADLFNSSTTFGNTYQDSGSVYEDLVGKCGEYELPCWTASQANREANRVKGLVDLHHVADSYAKARVCHTMFTVNQDQNEYNHNKLRLYTARHRNHPKGAIHYFNTDFSRSKLECITKKSYDESITSTEDPNINEKVSKAGTINAKVTGLLGKGFHASDGIME